MADRHPAAVVGMTPRHCSDIISTFEQHLTDLDQGLQVLSRLARTVFTPPLLGEVR